MKKKQKRHISPFAWLGLIAYLIVSVFLVEMNFTTFQASIISTQTQPAYDGLAAPIKKAPNWVALSGSEWDMNYTQLNQLGKLVDFPVYNPSNLKISTDSLVWGNKAHDAIRNEKITFSVPYMGNYKLDGQEYAGSHLAVDIKTPMGTPVYAIGNATVDKTSEQLYGFGKHIVLEHKGFPSYDNASNKTTYYSSYSHLSSVLVSEGDIVHKGDLIGYSGSTGTSTTPHLHFQIDNTSAPWHPYWPFTSKEASDAGLTFTQAINTGLNQSIAIQNTINPFMYIQKYGSSSPSTSSTSSSTSSSSSSTSSSTTTTTTTTPATTVTEEVEEVEEVEETEIFDEEPTDEYVTFQIDTQSTYEEGEVFTAKIKAILRNGETVTNYVPESAVKLEIIRGSATIDPTRLTSKDFKNGVATVTITTKNTSPIQFRVKTDNVMKDSPVIAQGLFMDVSEVHPHFQAISFLKNEGVIEGYPDGSFKPENSVSRVEVLKFILEGIDAEIANTNSLPFTDTENGTWYADYLQTAIYLGIVDGYPDGSFKPGNTVNKVEFLKMLINAMDVDVNPEIGYLPFDDVDKDHWFAPYVQFAYRRNLIDTEGRKFNPQEEMTRENVAEAMYRVQVLTQTGAASFNSEAAAAFNHAG